MGSDDSVLAANEEAGRAARLLGLALGLFALIEDVSDWDLSSPVPAPGLRSLREAAIDHALEAVAAANSASQLTSVGMSAEDAVARATDGASRVARDVRWLAQLGLGVAQPLSESDETDVLERAAAAVLNDPETHQYLDSEEPMPLSTNRDELIIELCGYFARILVEGAGGLLIGRSHRALLEIRCSGYPECLVVGLDPGDRYDELIECGWTDSQYRNDWVERRWSADGPVLLEVAKVVLDALAVALHGDLTELVTIPRISTAPAEPEKIPTSAEIELQDESLEWTRQHRPLVRRIFVRPIGTAAVVFGFGKLDWAEEYDVYIQDRPWFEYGAQQFVDGESPHPWGDPESLSDDELIDIALHATRLHRFPRADLGDVGTTSEADYLMRRVRRVQVRRNAPVELKSSDREPEGSNLCARVYLCATQNAFD